MESGLLFLCKALHKSLLLPVLTQCYFPKVQNVHFGSVIEKCGFNKFLEKETMILIFIDKGTRVYQVISLLLSFL